MYLPTLRVKNGELQALKEFTKHTSTKDKTSSLLPNFVITDASQNELDKIMQSYTSHTLLDTRQLDSEEIIDLVELIKAKENEQFDIIFPLNLLISEGIDDTINHDDVKYVAISNLKNISPLYLNGLKNYLNILPKNVILDLGYIDSSSVTPELDNLIRLLSDKQVFILSGSVPAPIPVKSNVNYNQQMFSVELFNKIKGLNIIDNNHLNYGDYAVNHPIQDSNYDSTFAIPIVQIKYTKSDKQHFWFVRNGQRKGDYDFRSVADAIVNDKNYVSNSWGDYYLEEYLNGNKSVGNATTWTAISVNRHISLFV